MAQGKLGFGFMRLPVIDGAQENIDMEQLKQMVDEFLGNGFTYFDTSYAYHNGKSEEALRKSVVERYPRAVYHRHEASDLSYTDRGSGGGYIRGTA